MLGGGDRTNTFDIQGLELDWAGVCWDANFRRDDTWWIYRKFTGIKWNNIRVPLKKAYLENAYRVLLTRARQGMVIYVPEGDKEDRTRSPEDYNSIFAYLLSCGIPLIDLDTIIW